MTYRERTTITRGDLRLAYQEWGSAEDPVILTLHGFGVSGHMFDEFSQRSAGRYHFINLDQRGHGDSEWASDGDYTREAFVEDVEVVRESLGFETVILMGHSMGGLNAVEYTFQHPERVSALILVDVGPEAAKEGVDNIMRFTRGPDELDFDQFVSNAMRFNTRRTEENIRERMRHRLRPLENGKWTWKFDKRFREGEGSVRSGSDMSSEDLWDRFRALVPPVLLVRGEQSDILSQEVAERLVAEMGRARLVVVPGAGHSVPGDNPDGFTSVILEFLTDVESGSFSVTSAKSIPIPKNIEELRRNWRTQDRGPSGMTLVASVAVVLAGVAAVGAFLFLGSPGTQVAWVRRALSSRLRMVKARIPHRGRRGSGV